MLRPVFRMHDRPQGTLADRLAPIHRLGDEDLFLTLRRRHFIVGAQPGGRWLTVMWRPGQRPAVIVALTQRW